MELVLYSTHCPKCKVIEKKLADKGLEYKLVDDIDEVVNFGKEHNKNSAPLLVVDGDVKEFVEANKFLTVEVKNETCGECSF